MGKAVLVLPASESKEVKRNSLTSYLFEKKFFKKRARARLYTFLNKREFWDCLDEIPLGDLEPCYILKLPFYKKEIKNFNSEVLAEAIEKRCLDLGSCSIYLPQFMNDIRVASEVRNDDHAYNGMLFKAVLDIFLQELYKNSDIRIENLGSLIVLGEDTKDFFYYLTMLEPWMKAITIAVKDDEQLENVGEKVTSFAQETGLSVIIVTDVQRAVKNAKLILNFADQATFPQARMESKAVIFNLSDLHQTKQQKKINMPDECLVINGLEFVLPEEILLKLPAPARKYFDEKTLSKIILFNNQPKDANRLREDFIKYGCRFTAVKGRRGIIDMTVAKRHIA